MASVSVETGAGPSAKWIAASLGEVAEFFGVSRDTVRKEWTKRGMPGGKGSFPLSSIFRWWQVRQERDVGDGGEAVQLDDNGLVLESYRRLYPEKALKYERALAAALRNAQMQQAMVTRETALREASALVALVADELTSMPERVALEVAAEHRETIRQRCLFVIEHTLRRLYEWETRQAVLGAAPQDLPPP